MHDADPERVRSALQFIDPHDRATWVKAAFAIKSEFGEGGFDLWDEWGSAHPRPASEVKSTWKSAKPGGKVGLGSLFYDAKALGWKDDSKHEKPSADVIEKRKAAAAARAAQYAAEEAAEQSAAADWAQRLWDAATPTETHAYLERKDVRSHGLRVGSWEYVDASTGEVYKIPGCLLIPMRDRTRKLWSLQCIEPDAKAAKRYLKGGAKRGNFFPVGSQPLEHDGRKVFVLAEGYATCASVHEATGHMVLCCFDASNLLAVAQQVRERDANAIILFAADNDLWNRKPDGTPYNPGVEAATKAAKEVAGIVAIPPFTAEDSWGVDDKGNPTGPKDFNDLHGINGGQFVAGVIADALAGPAAPPEPEKPTQEPERAIPEDNSSDGFEDIDPSAHFAVLGYDRGDFYVFIHEQRQISVFRPGELTEANLLMMAPLDWWEMYFPAAKGGMERKAILNWFFRLAARRGIYDISRLRGRGAWDDEGRVVYHQGSKLFVDGVETDVTKIRSKFVYELAKAQGGPSATPLTDGEGNMLLDVAKMFRWSKPGAAALLAGWTFLAPVCGAIKWRPHIWLTGGAGSGKSTILNDYVSHCLGRAKLFAQGNSTEAGIRQELGQDALPVLFDESEKNNEQEARRMDAILALIRQASTESDARTYKGTMSGSSMHFHIRSMFCLASIQVGMENKADQDRLTKLALLKPDEHDPKATDNWNAIKEVLYKIGRDKDLPGRMLRRAIDMLPLIQQNITVFVDVAARHFGTQRMGDQYGTMLAGAWSLTHSTLATPEDAMALINAYDWSEFLDGTEVDDSEKALQAILESKITHKGEAISIGSIVSVASGRFVDGLSLEANVAGRILRDCGMKVERTSLVFRNNSTALKNLVAGTRFEADLKGQLLRLKGASVTKSAVRFGAGNDVQRGVAVPLSLILGDDEPPI